MIPLDPNVSVFFSTISSLINFPTLGLNDDWLIYHAPTLHWLIVNFS